MDASPNLNTGKRWETATRKASVDDIGTTVTGRDPTTPPLHRLLEL
jgi:hypothetical protein